MKPSDLMYIWKYIQEGLLSDEGHIPVVSAGLQTWKIGVPCWNYLEVGKEGFVHGPKLPEIDFAKGEPDSQTQPHEFSSSLELEGSQSWGVPKAQTKGGKGEQEGK